MVKAKLPDGRELEFPDGTNPQIIQNKVKELLGKAPSEKPSLETEAKPKPTTIKEDVSTPQQALRAAEFGSRGFLDSASETVGALPELVSSGMRSVGLPAPQAGYYPETIKQGLKSFGQTISAPVNYLLDGYFGANEPQTAIDRMAYGSGRGAADAASFILPAAAVAKAAKAGSKTQKIASTMAAQPILQTGAMAAGGAVQEATDSPGLGIATSLAIPVAANIARRAVSPFASQLSSNEQRLAQTAKDAGIPLTSGQVTGSPTLRRTEQAFAQLPFTSNPQAAVYDAQRKAFNRVVLEKAGINADEATPAVIDDAFTSIGREFDDLAKVTVIKPDKKLIDDINEVAEEYGRRLPTDIKPVFQSYVDDFNNMQKAMRVPNANVQIGGAEYQALSSQIKARARQATASDPALRDALYGLSKKIDDALERSAGPDLKNSWKDVRNRYRNLLVIDKAASAGTQADRASSNIPYSGLRSAVRQMDKSGYGRGRGDLNELSRVADFLGAQKIPDPGTAGMATTMGVLTGGGAGTLMGADLLTTGGMIAGMLAGPKLAQMGYQTPIMSRYLQNQLSASPRELTPLLGQIGLTEQVGEAKRTGRDPYLLRTGQ
tara:strand:- start:72 stop:1886 length:1815 start_codon:yes stop_codon:yes gene_type:complete